MTRLVILDRDGVINQDSDDFIKSTDEWQPIDGSLDAIGRLTRAGYTVAVATNQSGVGRGLLSEEMLAAIHRKLVDEARRHGGIVDAIEYCPHRPDEGCDCRKPLPGLLLRLAARYGTELGGVPVIGDSRRDLDAAMAVHARPVLVRTGKGAKTERELVEAGVDVETFDDLGDAVDGIVDATR